MMSPLREIILFSPVAGKCEQSLLFLMTLIFVMSSIFLTIYATPPILHLPIFRFYKILTVIYRHLWICSNIFIRSHLYFCDPICTGTVYRFND